MSAADPAHVLIAGGGIAGVEAVLALRDLAGDRVEITVVDPAELFVVRATSTASAVGGPPVDSRPLDDVVAAAGAALVPGRLAAVDADRRVAMLEGGDLLTYDHLIVAAGAHPEPHLRGALTFAGPADGRAFRAMLDRAAGHGGRGQAPRLVIVVPPGTPWPLVAYELALLSASYLDGRGARDALDISIVTSEDSALALFGQQAGAAVGRDLAAAGIALRTGALVRDWRWGRLELVGGEIERADRVVALPVPRGPAIDGLSADAHGFVRVGSDGAAVGAPGVWAVGDASSFPLKQGGIACQQADAVAAAIARSLGAPAETTPFEPVLRGWVWDGRGGRFLRADVAGGRDESEGVTGGASPLWWPPGKVAGRHLAPFLARTGTVTLADAPPAGR